MASPDFASQLKSYKQQIDADIAAYSTHARQAATQQYGVAGGQVSGVFLDLLELQAGKRIRGALVMVGYEMLGGADQQMIVRAATAIEMIHAYMLVVDDIQDRSLQRRGQPTVHVNLTNGPLGQGNEHVGMSLALNSALAGGHAAQMLLAGLNVEPDLARKAIGIVNHTMIVTSHGQTYDLLYEQPDAHPTEADLERVLHWKTAEYTFLNPLCVGMVLAGAGCEDTDAIRDYALHTGKAFQIADDIKGIFGTEADNGKDVREDIREGKRTFLTVYALAHAEAADRAFLTACLGNNTLSEADFKRCQEIIRRSGALGHAHRLLEKHCEAALHALGDSGRGWAPWQVGFLRELTIHLLKLKNSV